MDFYKVEDMRQKTLNQKIAEAKQRTRHFFLGIKNIEWPCESCNLERFKPEITNGGWGGKREKGVRHCEDVDL